MSASPRYLVIGAGNGCRAMAADLALPGRDITTGERLGLLGRDRAALPRYLEEG